MMFARSQTVFGCGRPRLVACVGLLVLLALAGVARGAEFIEIGDGCRGRQLLVRGAIEPGDAERFATALARLVLNPDLPPEQEAETLWTVKLDSPGGDIDEGMAIGRLLRRALAVTEVSYRFEQRSDGVYDFARAAADLCIGGEGRLAGCEPDILKAECAGACVLAWLGGASRFAHEGLLGIHGLPASGPAAERVARYLGEMEVADPGVLALRQSLATDVRWLSWPERSRIDGFAPSFARELEGCPVRLNQQESLDSVMDPDPAVRDHLMDRAEAHLDCRLAIEARAHAVLAPELAARLAPATASGAGRP